MKIILQDICHDFGSSAIKFNGEHDRAHFPAPLKLSISTLEYSPKTVRVMIYRDRFLTSNSTIGRWFLSDFADSYTGAFGMALSNIESQKSPNELNALFPPP